jgi:hypothetical protein
MTHALSISAHPRSGAGRQVVLEVELEARGGRRWRAVGGGSTLEEALAFARESAPNGNHWQVIRFADLYGE